MMEKISFKFLNIWSVKFVRPCTVSILGIILLEQNRVAKKKTNMSTIGKWNVGKEESLCFNSKTR